MHSSPSPFSNAAGVAALGQPGRLFWRNPSGKVGVVGRAVDAEAAQRALLYRSEAFAEDLGPGYARMALAADAANAAVASAAR